MSDCVLPQRRSRRKKILFPFPRRGNRIERGSRAVLSAILSADATKVAHLDISNPRRTPTLPRIRWPEFISSEGDE
jgi:hypothetical protein